MLASAANLLSTPPPAPAVNMPSAERVAPFALPAPDTGPPLDAECGAEAPEPAAVAGEGANEDLLACFAWIGPMGSDPIENAVPPPACGARLGGGRFAGSHLDPLPEAAAADPKMGSGPVFQTDLKLGSGPVFPPLDLGRPGIGAPLAERVLWAIDGDVQEAVIDVSPTELGPLRIRIRTEGEVTRVDLAAAAPQTRALLRESLGELAQLLSVRGLVLSDVSVTSLAGTSRNGGAASADALMSAASSGRRRVFRVGLVDDYA